MAQSINNIFEVAYDAEVKRGYQGKVTLRDTVYTKGEFRGKSLFFRKVGQLVSQEHNAYADMTYGDAGYTQIECKHKNFNCPTMIDKPETYNFSFDEAVI